MDSLTTAIESADAVANVTSFFMLAGETYAKGGEAGFAGLDFYVAGRGGVLGDVDADVVAAAFTFFEPNHIRTQWEAGRQVMAPADAGVLFASCLADWGAAKVPDDLDLTRLAELAGTVVGAARPAGAPVFAAWRAVIEVPEDDARTAALFHLNALRELRAGLHGCAVVASGLSPHEAVSHRTPGMLPIFGWGEALDVADKTGVWDGAEAATNRAMAHAFEVLDDGERQEFTDLARQLYAAVR